MRTECRVLAVSFLLVLPPLLPALAPAASADEPETVHVILQLEDQGDPHLYAYRRAIVTVKP